jgi:oligopeptide/dipeptide ABC transporter ATP-binding protein
MSSADAHPVVVVDRLSKRFDEHRGWFRRGPSAGVEAVTDLSFEIPRGGSLALVGESGSGKTTTARIIVGLEQPTSGEARVAGQPVAKSAGAAQRKQLARKVQMVFQDPYMSLDPRQTVRRMLDEVLSFHTERPSEERAKRIEELVESVGLPKRSLGALPRELSGGQRQRAAISRALASEPEILVLDEAVSSLDTSVQAQILNLLAELRTSFALSYLVISHDLAVARQIADRVVVMYRGAAVETGTVDEVLQNPRHPYTQQLLRSVPHAGMELPRRTVVAESERLPGCRFRDRCPARFDRCVEEPDLLEISGPERAARCWLVEVEASEVGAQGEERA